MRGINSYSIIYKVYKLLNIAMFLWQCLSVTLLYDIMSNIMSFAIRKHFSCFKLRKCKRMKPRIHMILGVVEKLFFMLAENIWIKKQLVSFISHITQIYISKYLVLLI